MLNLARSQPEGNTKLPPSWEGAAPFILAQLYEPIGRITGMLNSVAHPITNRFNRQARAVELVDFHGTVVLALRARGAGHCDSLDISISSEFLKIRPKALDHIRGVFPYLEDRDVLIHYIH